MIRITIESLPADIGTRSILGVFEVANVTGDGPVADYSVVAKYGTGAEQQFTLREHLRHLGWLSLARRALDQAAIRFGLPAAEHKGDPRP